MKGENEKMFIKTKAQMIINIFNISQNLTKKETEECDQAKEISKSNFDIKYDLWSL